MGKKKREIPGAARAIGARIRVAREEIGVSIAELGLAYGKNRQTVQFWERGENFPPLSEFPKLCDLLKTDANSILGLKAMKPLTEQEVAAARTKIQLMASAKKAEGAARKRPVRRGLQPRQDRA